MYKITLNFLVLSRFSNFRYWSKRFWGFWIFLVRPTEQNFLLLFNFIIRIARVLCWNSTFIWYFFYSFILLYLRLRTPNENKPWKLQSRSNTIPHSVFVVVSLLSYREDLDLWAHFSRNLSKFPRRFIIAIVRCLLSSSFRYHREVWWLERSGGCFGITGENCRIYTSNF